MEIVNLPQANQVKINCHNIHYSILRDLCRCDSCYNATTQERQHNLLEFNPKLTILKIEQKQNDQIKIIWSDRHKSVYNKSILDDFLLYNSKDYERINWGRDIDLLEFDYKLIFSDKKYLNYFLSSFLKIGLVKIVNCPLKTGLTEELANHISCVREISFARLADIKLDPNAYTLGFTSSALPLHTDCSGYRHPPGAFLFQCIENTVEGGENNFSDCENTSNILINEHQRKYEVLSKISVYHRLFSKSHDTSCYAPCIDKTNGYTIYRYANWAIRPEHIDPNKIIEFYESYKEFGRIAKKNSLTLKMHPTEMLFINNHRVLHGRKSFTVNKNTHRHFQQVYIDLDDIEARWRQLR